MSDPGPSLRWTRPPSAAAYMLRAFWPGRRERTLHPRLALAWAGARWSEEDLAAFEALTSLSDTTGLGLLAPHVLGFRLTMALLTRPEMPVPIWGILQTRNHLVELCPVARDAALDLDARVSAGRVVDKGAELDVLTTARVDGAVVWQSLVTFFTRGRWGAAEAPSPLAAPPQVRAEPSATWRLEDAGHALVGRLTGDHNGLHYWDAYARRFGFPRAFYHPPRVLAECLARLPAPPPSGPRRLDVWLRGPVPHGAEVRLGVERAGAGAAFTLHAADARPCLVGRLGPAGASEAVLG
ncbi:MAG: acyl dehydratase [Polyangiaceae bacterium]|nr:acyl dehydratase [Polyangiaceae bacterium]